MSFSYDYEYTEFIHYPNARLFVVDLKHSHVHMHKEIELCYILSGEVSVHERHQSIRYAKGDFFLFNSREIHEIYSISEPTSLILSLQISPAFCINYFPEIVNVAFDRQDINGILSDGELSSLKALVRSLSECYFSQDPLSPFHCTAQVALILSFLLEKVPRHHVSESEKINSINTSSRIDRIVAYVEDHYTERILLKDIAEKEGVTLGYLSHFFREWFDLSFQEYVAKLRFEKARRLLIRTDLSLTSVSIACGFPDCRQMRKVFQQLAGCDPTDYRNTTPSEHGLFIVRPLNSIENELDSLECLDMIRKHL